MSVGQQVQTAQFLPPAVGVDLTGELVCYARSVIRVEWARMEDGSLDEEINPWGVAMFGTLQAAELGSPNQEAAYQKWLDQTSTREEARQVSDDPYHGGVGGLQPTAMERTVQVIDQQLAVTGGVPIPCDEAGNPV